MKRFFSSLEDEQRNGLIRIAISAVLLGAAMLLPLDGTVKLAALIISYAVCGWDVVWSALRNIAHGELFDEKFLMMVATIGAFAIGKYSEAAAVMLFYQVGEWFQDAAVDKSRRDIAALMNIRPDTATVLRDGTEMTVSPEDVHIGDIISIKPGERVPLDSVIEEGQTAVDTSALTGESLPRNAGIGDVLMSGTMNISGVVHARVKSEYAQSTVARILEMVENASEKKARTENFITRFSRCYTPCVVITALLLAVFPPLLLGQPWGEWINRALIFLVVSCPCALVVSVPLSFFGGIGGASREGILIKGSSYLEALSKARTAVFDKTGTLTHGLFTVSAVHPTEVSEDELLDIAAVAESNSSHPIAQSIVKAHKGHIDSTRIKSVTEHSGLGVEAVIDDRVILAGNDKLMKKAGVEWRECHHSGTIIHIAADGRYIGHIVISDIIKPDAKQTIADIKGLGVTRTVLLTGDLKQVAESVGAELGVDEIRAELLPSDKVASVEQMITPDAPLCFVGDGINDAPVLSRADVGIAMGALGSDAAIEAADVVIMDDKPSKLPKAICIARKTMRIVKQNIAFALSVKAIVLALGAIGVADMWFAVFADVGVMVLAILNALRAMKRIKR